MVNTHHKPITPIHKPTEPYQLPAEGFARLHHVIGDPKRGIPPVIPESRSSFLAKVKAGIYPQPVKLGGCTVWRVEDIRALIQSL